jgi:beta-glucosidase
MVYRILYSMFQGGLFDSEQTGDLDVDARSKERAQLSRKVAEEGTVLLKNDRNILPLSTGVKKIAVIGSDAHDEPVFHGDGSGGVWSEYVVTPLQGIKTRVPQASVTYTNSTAKDLAVQQAKNADVAIIFVSKKSGEGNDYNLNFEENENQLVKAVVQAQPNTIVVAHVPSAVVMPWADMVRGIVCAFYPGQENGNAIASILFGNVNPSGKLPVTFPTNEKEIPVNTPIQYPGINKQTNYTEKLQVGYRWYDANGVQPQFAFGHGLSYTTFNFTDIHLEGLTVHVTIQNTGSRDGAEVVQMYLTFPKSAGEPPQQLKNFTKVFLKARESQSISFTITDQDLSIYDVATAAWKVVYGEFRIRIASSSRDMRSVLRFARY